MEVKNVSKLSCCPADSTHEANVLKVFTNNLRSSALGLLSRLTVPVPDEWPSQVSMNMLVYSRIFTLHSCTQCVDSYTARL